MESTVPKTPNYVIMVTHMELSRVTSLFINFWRGVIRDHQLNGPYVIPQRLTDYFQHELPALLE
jgi:hypothetical protein